MNLLLLNNEEAFRRLPREQMYRHHIVAHWRGDFVVIKKDRFSLNPGQVMTGEEFISYLDSLRSPQVWESI